MGEQNRFLVKIPAFEGPLELLLSLIEKRKLFINDVSLAKVADDYIEHLKKLQDFPMADISQFILVASTLLLIKSKSLLPTLDLSSEEEEDVSDLERRLKLLRLFRELSVHVKDNFGKEMIFPRPTGRMVEPILSPSEDLNMDNLLSALRKALNELPKFVQITKTIVGKVVSLEETIERLIERVKKNIKLSFSEFSGRNGGKAEKVEVIVSFLAMLELVKRSVISVSQREHFGEIDMETNGFGVPDYR